MRLISLVAAASCASVVFATPVATSHYIHEKRDELPRDWIRRDRLDSTAVLPMRVALAQSNLDRAWEWLSQVSSPDSEKYGQHWSAKEVAEAFAPSTESLSSVRAWLASAGIGSERIRQAQSLGFLEYEATVNEVERLLKTKYHVYEHAISGQQHVACEAYSLPSHLKEHVDFVYPTVHFDAKIKNRVDKKIEKRAAPPESTLGKPNSPSLPKLGQYMSKSQLIKELEQCDLQITPDCLRLLYQFGYGKYDKSSYGIVEYTPQAYVPSDLDMFFRNFSPIQVGDRPVLDSIDGGVVQQTNMSFEFNGESDLDLEYAMTLVYPQQVTLYQTGDLVEGASFNTFLDAIDGSYCTYEGGDELDQDQPYPDPFNITGAYKGPLNCGGYAATKVISTSYAYDEHDLTPAYEERQCNEYLKLGMMGISVLYSSGDYGVAGNGGYCIDGPGLNASYINGTLGGRFNPSFPGTCPYITSVGATQVKPNVSVPYAIATGTEPEEACETIIYSGGGFSNVFPLPSYQAAAVHEYFEKYPPPYGADKYNNSQKTRGFPDVAANGANYIIAVDGQFALVYGTSCASPVFGSILTLINEERAAFGMSSVGFINPVAYAHPEVFNDITQGTNQGCATEGFSAEPGWDPVTGLGTPNYPKMLKLWLELGGWKGGNVPK